MEAKLVGGTKDGMVVDVEDWVASIEFNIFDSLKKIAATPDSFCGGDDFLAFKTVRYKRASKTTFKHMEAQ